MTEVLSEMSDDQAASALFDAIAEDTGREAYGDTSLEPAAVEPEVQESKQEPVTPEGETEEVATPEAEAEADTFTKLDPNAIPDELKPWYESMQADYTRKTQALAGIRKQYEGLGEVDPAEAQAALTLFQTLQDPQGALAFHERLTTTLTEMGLTPAQAQAEATRQIQEVQQTPAEPTWEDDPEAAVRAELDSVKQQLAQFQQNFSAREQALQQQQLEAAAMAELDRQTSLIRESNPHYTESDMNAIYELAPYHEGNLLSAQGRYEDIVAERVNRLMATKASAASVQGVQTIGGTGTAHEPPTFGDDLEAAHRAAVEHLRALEA